MSKKKRIYTIIQIGSIDDIPSRTYDIALMLAVVINIFIAIFETFPQSDRYLYILRVVESITVLFFTIDYLLRIWTATYLYKGVTVARARRNIFFLGWHSGFFILRAILSAFLFSQSCSRTADVQNHQDSAYLPHPPLL